MGAALGGLFGLGLLLVVWSRTGPPPVRRKRLGRSSWLRHLLAEAGHPFTSPRLVLAACAASALVTFLAVAGASASVPIAAAFAAFAGYGPIALLRAQRRRRSVELRELWPEVVDNLASAVRAGLGLGEALADLGERGPSALRGPFASFGQDYRATGRFSASLDRLKESLADPTGDRVVEAVRMAREVGGTELGRLLRTLSDFLREDARTRAEIATRQGWTVNAARLALGAPWIVLGLFALRPASVAAYNSPTGALVLLAGGGVSLLAYRVMLRIARLPEEERVLR
ncbi:MAG: type II secretion system F family protein [Mycobacteriales bacterium]